MVYLINRKFLLIVSLILIIMSTSFYFVTVFAAEDKIDVEIDDSLIGKNIDSMFIGLKPFTEKELEDKLKKKNKIKVTDPEEQYIIGFMYFYGINTFQNDIDAEKWFLKAAKQKHIKAMVALGKLYRLLGSSKALKWLNTAAKANDPYAKFELGLLYETGFFVFQSDKRAFKYYKEAARADVIDAHMKLGQFYKEGTGAKKDIQKALFHYKKIKELSNSQVVKDTVTRMVGGVYRQIAAQEESPEKALKWLLIAAEYGDVRSQISVADLYKDGYGVEQDLFKAVEWYKKAARVGDVYSMETLGNIYTNGIGVEQDYCEAQRWFIDAAENEKGSIEASWNLCTFYTNGYCDGKIIKEEADRWCAIYRKLRK